MGAEANKRVLTNKIQEKQGQNIQREKRKGRLTGLFRAGYLVFGLKTVYAMLLEGYKFLVLEPPTQALKDTEFRE